MPDGSSVTETETEGQGLSTDISAGGEIMGVGGEIGVSAPSSTETGTITTIDATEDGSGTTVTTGTIQTETASSSGTIGGSIDPGPVEVTAQAEDLVEVQNTQTQTTSAEYPDTELGNAQADNQVENDVPSVGPNGEVTENISSSTTITENGMEGSISTDAQPTDNTSIDIGPGTINIDNVETTTDSLTVTGTSTDGNITADQPIATEQPEVDTVTAVNQTTTIEEAPDGGHPGFTASNSTDVDPGVSASQTTQATTTDGASINASNEEVQQAAQAAIFDGSTNPIVQDVANGATLTEATTNNANSGLENITNGHDNEDAVGAINEIGNQLDANDNFGDVDTRPDDTSIGGPATDSSDIDSGPGKDPLGNDSNTAPDTAFPSPIESTGVLASDMNEEPSSPFDESNDILGGIDPDTEPSGPTPVPSPVDTTDAGEDTPGPGEGSLNAAEDSASPSDDDDDDEDTTTNTSSDSNSSDGENNGQNGGGGDDDEDTPGPGEGSLDAAEDAASQSDDDDDDDDDEDTTTTTTTNTNTSPGSNSSDGENNGQDGGGGGGGGGGGSDDGDDGGGGGGGGNSLSNSSNEEAQSFEP